MPNESAEKVHFESFTSISETGTLFLREFLFDGRLFCDFVLPVFSSTGCFLMDYRFICPCQPELLDYPLSNAGPNR
jgi:hypothetical protein